MCPQRNDGVVEGTEDCLVINAIAPVDAEGLPVMVWMHGGAFINGSVNVPYYNGTDLAKNGVVVMMMNYRLGALGFLADEALVDT